MPIHHLSILTCISLVFLIVHSSIDDSGDEGPLAQPDRALIQGALKTLASKLDDLSTCNELIGKHGAALQRSLSELEDLRAPTDGADKLKTVNERATLFRITSNAMINVSSFESTLCTRAANRKVVGSNPRRYHVNLTALCQACQDFVDLAEAHSRRWQRSLQYEREQRHHLEETIELLAKQHNSLERAWRESPSTHNRENKNHTSLNKHFESI